MANPFGPTIQQATAAANERTQQRMLDIAQLDQGGLSAMAGLMGGRAIGQAIGGALGADMRPPEVVQAEKMQVLRGEFERAVMQGVKKGLSDADAMERAADSLNLPWDVDKAIRDEVFSMREQSGKLKELDVKTKKMEVETQEKAQLLGYAKDKLGIYRHIKTKQPLFPKVAKKFMLDKNAKKAKAKQDARFDRGFEIYNKYLADKQIEEFQLVDTAFNELVALTPQQGFASDIPFIFRFFQFIEPSGVVREGEQDLLRFAAQGQAASKLRVALKGTGIDLQSLKEWIKGERDFMPLAVKRELLVQAKKMYEKRRVAAIRVQEKFKRIGKAGKLDPEELSVFVPDLPDSSGLRLNEFGNPEILPGSGQVGSIDESRSLGGIANPQTGMENAPRDWNDNQGRVNYMFDRFTSFGP